MKGPFLYLLIVAAVFTAPGMQAQSLLQAESKDTPGLRGFLGRPGFAKWVEGGMLWHRNGLIFGLGETLAGGMKPLTSWRMDVRTGQWTREAVYRAGEAWCVSQSGDLLCAHAPRMDDDPALDPERTGLAKAAGAFTCFRRVDGQHLWKFPLRQGEFISGTAFSVDDKAVLMVCQWSKETRLILLDAVSGMLQREHTFPERRDGRVFNVSCLTMRPGEAWMFDHDAEKQALLRIPLSTLEPQRFDCPWLEDFYGSVTPGLDSGHILAYNNRRVVCLAKTGKEWRSVHEDEDFVTLDDQVPGEFFRGAWLLPGSRLLVMTSGSARVTDLVKKQTRRIKLDPSYGGVPSPDGSHLLMLRPSGLELVSLRETDARRGPRVAQNAQPPHRMRFSEDGRTLFAADIEGITLWDIVAGRPRARLLACGPENAADLNCDDFSIVSGGAEVVSSECGNWVRWKLPQLIDAAPEKPLVIDHELAFGGVRQEAGSPHVRVFGRTDGRWFVSTRGGLMLQKELRRGTIHDRLGPGESRSASEDISGIAAGLWFFGPDDLFTGFNQETLGWQKLDLRSGTVTALPRGGRYILAVLPLRGWCVSEDLRAENLADRKEWKDLELPDSRFEAISGVLGAVSRDEKLVAMLVRSHAIHQQRICVWDTTTFKCIGSTPVPGDDGISLAFSPDGSLLVCGHDTTAISLWKVEQLPGFQPPAKPVEPARPVTPPKTAGTASTPESRLFRHDYHGVKWEFGPNGTVTQAEALPEAGALRVGGVEFVSKQRHLTLPQDLRRYFDVSRDIDAEFRRLPTDAPPRPLPASRRASVVAGLIQLSEGSAGETWVARQIGNPAASASRFLLFTDTLTHQGLQEKTVPVEFDVKMPAGTKTFMDSSFKDVPVESDGTLRLPEHALWVAGITGDARQSSLPIFLFRCTSGGATPRLRWQPHAGVLTASHSAALHPGETRHLMHGLCVQGLEEGRSPSQINTPLLDADWFGRLTAFMVSSQGLNFAVPQSAAAWDRKVRPHRRVTDVFGFKWDKNFDGSLVDGEAIGSALQPWIDEAPLPGAAPGVFVELRHEDVSPMDLAVIYGNSLDFKLRLNRMVGSSQEQEMVPVIDRLFNVTKEPVTSRLAYISTFREPVKAFYDATGKPLQPGNATPQPASTFGGALIVEFASAERPATAFVFHESGAKVEPKVSWPVPSMLRIEYEAIFPPGKTCQFWHGVTRRSLASFSSVSEAFTGALPFKRQPATPDDSLMNVK